MLFELKKTLNDKLMNTVHRTTDATNIADNILF